MLESKSSKTEQIPIVKLFNYIIYSYTVQFHDILFKKTPLACIYTAGCAKYLGNTYPGM